MTREQFRKYRNLPRERDYYESRIKALERKAENIPIVKDKVQSSQKEWPYIGTHETVDAPDPRRSSKIQREIRRYKVLLKRAEKDLDELAGLLSKVEDARTRQILTARYVEGRKLKETAIRFELTEQHVLRIINDGIKKI